MKRKAFKRQRKRVTDLVTYWQPKLGLGWWSIDLDFYDDAGDFIKAEGDSQAAFRVWARWQYLKATIAVNAPAVKSMSDRKLAYAVVHELCHLLVNEMREADPDGKHEERVVTVLSNVMIWLHDGGWDDDEE